MTYKLNVQVLKLTFNNYAMASFLPHDNNIVYLHNWINSSVSRIKISTKLKVPLPIGILTKEEQKMIRFNTTVNPSIRN